MATSVDSSDLYLCQICLEDQTARKPRLLSCHHSFCEECIDKLVKKGKIECPTCRQMTLVDDEDVKTLSMNFMLLQVKEQMINMAKMLSSQKILCQLCKTGVVTDNCKECDYPLCTACCKKHKCGKEEEEKDTSMYSVCPNHPANNYTHFCLKCVRGVCSHCDSNKSTHSDHEEELVPYEEGINKLKTNIYKLKDRCDKKLVKIINCKDVDTKSLNEIEVQEKEWKALHEIYVAKTQNILDNVDMIKKYKEEAKLTMTLYDTEKEKIYNLEKSLQETLTAEDGEIIKQYSNVIQNTEKEINMEIQKVYIPEISFPFQNKDVQSSDSYWDQPEVRFLKQAELVFETKDLTPLGIKEPSHIQCIEPGVTLVADIKSAVMVTIDNNGQIIRKYNLSPFGVKQVVFYDQSSFWTVLDSKKVKKHFYVLNNSEIEKRVYPGFEIITTYRPNLKNIGYIFVVQDTMIIIYDSKLERIYEYNTIENKIKRVAANITLSSMTRFGIFGQMMGYCILDEINSKLLYTTTDWHMLREVRLPGMQLNHPKSFIATAYGLLVANTGDNALDFESYLRPLTRPNVLTADDGIKSPVSLDLIYDKENNARYLWIAEYNLQDGHAAIKCLKTEYD